MPADSSASDYTESPPLLASRGRAGPAADRHHPRRHLLRHRHEAGGQGHGLAELKLPAPLLMRLPPAERPLLLAALCHDLGEMHTAPTLLDSGHAITPDERRYVHVHPLASHMVLNAVKDVPVAARIAVLQHHEWLDGSGYPNGLRADKITPQAKLLAAPAEPERSPLAFLFERMNTIHQLVLQAGFDPDRSESMLFVAQDDPEVLLELRTVLDEIEWLLHGLPSKPLQDLLERLRPA